MEPSPMASPFPGMDPFLEHPSFWPQIQRQLMEMIAHDLVAQLGARYDVLLEERRYEVVEADPLSRQTPEVSPPLNQVQASGSEDPPAQPITVRLPMPRTIKEDYLEIREIDSEALVTVVEVLSLHHKREGVSRQRYEQRRNKILESLTHLVEIDLLRQGEAMPMSALESSAPYRVLISRSQYRPDADLYAFTIVQRLPTFPIPLLSEESEPMIDLNEILSTLYEQGDYGSRIDYQQDPTPAFMGEEAEWVEQRLRRRGYR